MKLKKFQGPTMKGTSHAPTLEIHILAKLILLMVEN